LPWPADYRVAPRFNPWPVKYLLPAIKWFPLYWPNEPWEIIGIGGARPVIPDGAIVPWWKLPRDQWPVEAPWEPKIFGAWPASQITMRDDLVNNPPFGVIKLAVPGQRVTKCKNSVSCK
jgi:hypothetical protein